MSNKVALIIATIVFAGVIFSSVELGKYDFVFYSSIVMYCLITPILMLSKERIFSRRSLT